jgi:transposase
LARPWPNAGLPKKGGTKRYGKVTERIGRIKERYRSVHKYYSVHVEANDKQIVTHIEWQRKDQPDPAQGQGVYFLRTNYPVSEEKQLWDIYNTIREVEAAFRTLKTDLKLRPIYHQKDAYTEAHLFLGLLAYQLVAAIRYQLRQNGLHYDWSNITRIMKTQKLVTVRQQAKTKTISLRLASKPINEVREIYKALGLKHYPFKTKKYVVYH